MDDLAAALLYESAAGVAGSVPAGADSGGGAGAGAEAEAGAGLGVEAGVEAGLGPGADLPRAGLLASRARRGRGRRGLRGRHPNVMDLSSAADDPAATSASGLLARVTAWWRRILGQTVGGVALPRTAVAAHLMTALWAGLLPQLLTFGLLWVAAITIEEGGVLSGLFGPAGMLVTLCAHSTAAALGQVPGAVGGLAQAPAAAAPGSPAVASGSGASPRPHPAPPHLRPRAPATESCRHPPPPGSRAHWPGPGPPPTSSPPRPGHRP